MADSPGADPHLTKRPSVKPGPHRYLKERSPSPLAPSTSRPLSPSGGPLGSIANQPLQAHASPIGPHRMPPKKAISPAPVGAHVQARDENNRCNTLQPQIREKVKYDASGVEVARFRCQTTRPHATPVSQQMSRSTLGVHQGNSHGEGGSYHPRLPESQPWEMIKIKVWKLPAAYRNVARLHQTLLPYGHVACIEFEQNDSAVALLSFHRPALFTDKIIRGGTRLLIERIKLTPRLVRSPASPEKMINEKMVVPINQIDFGLLTSEHRMMVMHTVFASPLHPALLMLDLHSENRHCLDFRFFLTTETEAPWLRVELQLNSPLKLKQIQHDDGHKELVITSQFPPKWWQSTKRDQLREVHESNRDHRKYQDWPRGWRRVTDFDLNPDERDLNPVSFLPLSPVIDTGRWLTWKLNFPVGIDHASYNAIIEILEGHNSSFEKLISANFETIPREDPVVWDLLDPHRASYESDLHEMQDEMTYLSQEIRYQLEVCISNNNIIEYTLSKQFLDKLSSLDRDFVRGPLSVPAITPALVILENVADSKRTFYNPMDIFDTYEFRHPRKRRLPKGCVLMRTAVITPTTFYVKTPTVEVSNRVIRDNLFAAGNFLRVKFEDEDPYGRLNSAAEYDNQHEVWSRIERCLSHGIDIAGRHYDWLACGNSQFRERGAYFFAPYSEEKTARNIRMALGDFSSINIVAKCMARIGQCFSTTRASTNIGSVEPSMIKDIERNGYCFTDGVGKVSPFVAQMVANELYTRCGSHDYPSAFQFRLGGFKGILVVDPFLKNRAIHLRPSQRKFDAPNVGLEIIKPSKFSSSTLNQQIILVLTGLGVPKQIFIDKMSKELQDIDHAMTDETTALRMLQKNVDFNQVTLTMVEMILDGFMESNEPFFQGLLRLWRTWNLKFLKEKAKIPIDQGAFVLGCVDETNTLKMNAGELPEIFLQIPGEEDGVWKTASGICLLARNPSLHPGDIRVVRAVECKALRHLKNVVVLPQQGQRPLANMCSGGDLDGDDYLVMWDSDLLPPKDQWNHPAMNYDPPTPIMCAGPVQDEHFIKFFIDYIKNDNLGSIATSHRATADYYAAAGGVCHENCLAFAQLHSQAVDFNKTGVPAEIPRDLWPQKYPHWIPGKPPRRQYVSKQVIGRLYDMVQPDSVSFSRDKAFDSRILDAYDLDKDMLEKAREFKFGYDRQIRRVMAQHSIKTEMEVWSAFVVDHNREAHWYSLAEDLGNLMDCIKADHQSQVREHLGLTDAGYMVSESAFDKLGPFVAAMYTITAEEALEWEKRKLVSLDDDADNGPLISFPWLFHKELGKIATKLSGPSSLKTRHTHSVRRKTPTAKSNYKAELYSVKLEPLREWTPEKPLGVGDHKEIVDVEVEAPVVEAAVPDSEEVTDKSECPISSRANSALASSRSDESIEDDSPATGVEGSCASDGDSGDGIEADDKNKAIYTDDKHKDNQTDDKPGIGVTDNKSELVETHDKRDASEKASSSSVEHNEEEASDEHTSFKAVEQLEKEEADANGSQTSEHVEEAGADKKPTSMIVEHAQQEQAEEVETALDRLMNMIG